MIKETIICHLFSRCVLSLMLSPFSLSRFLSLEKGHIMVFICNGEAQITTICSQHGETKTAGPPSKPYISVIQYLSLSCPIIPFLDILSLSSSKSITAYHI